MSIVVRGTMIIVTTSELQRFTDPKTYELKKAELVNFILQKSIDQYQRRFGIQENLANVMEIDVHPITALQFDIVGTVQGFTFKQDRECPQGSFFAHAKLLA
jgi:hypothetical protein